MFINVNYQGKPFDIVGISCILCSKWPSSAVVIKT